MSLLLATQAQVAQAQPDHEVELVLVQDSIDARHYDLPHYEAEVAEAKCLAVQLEYHRARHISDWIDRPYLKSPKFRLWPRVHYVYHHIRVKGQRYRVADIWSIKPAKKPKRATENATEK